MSILTAPRRSVKTPRPFAEGLVESEPAPLPSRPDTTTRFLVAKARVEARRDAAYRRALGFPTPREIGETAQHQIARLRAAAGRAGAARKAIASTATTTVEIKGRSYEATPLPTVEGVAVVRVGALDDAAATYDVSRGPDGLVACTCGDYVYRHAGTASTCKHGAACVEAGLIAASAPVATCGKSATSSLDGIPANVTRIRLTAESVADGIFARDGDRWARESDGRTIGGGVANREYRAGRVAILADAPKGLHTVNTPAPAVAETPAPAPEPVDPWDVEADPADWPADTDSDRWSLADLPIEAAPAPVTSRARREPSAEDRAFEAGRAIAIDCEGWATPPRHYTRAEVVMFEAGQVDGARVAHYRELARLEVLERQASVDHGDSYCW